jgi:transaldolase
LGKTLEIGQLGVVETSVQHVLNQIEHGETLAAADHIVVREPKGDVQAVIQELMHELPGFVNNRPGIEESVFTALIRIGLNLAGRDAQLAGWSPATVEKSLSVLREEMHRFESSWRENAIHAVDGYLTGMLSVNSGDSLTGLMAERIRKGLGSDRTASHFVDVYAAVARQTVYWKMVERGYCKFGNDYARGLETLRHLGFSQVSTNPVLAAKAFDEEPSLVKRLEAEINRNPSWKQDPRAHAHEIVIAGTLLALWSNLEVFRPLAILAKNKDYMISFQLNPNVAEDFGTSVEAAKRVYALAQEHLTEYDRSLGVENPGLLSPNIVFKVAGSSGSARQITRELNASGLGTNNTVTFTVAQEVRLIIDALEGKATAIRARKPVTRTYETNMGGRLVSHLREEEAKRILAEVAARRGEDEATEMIFRIAKTLNLSDTEIERAKRVSSVAEKADIVCAYKNMKSLTHEAFLEAAYAAGLTELQVQQLEMDLRKAGTLVAKRVYSTFYDERNRRKWMEWLERKHGLDHAEATLILDSMDILPASKRIPEDTLDTLASANMCNTEFPNHAKAVQLYSENPDFELAAYRDAVLRSPDFELVRRLCSVRDFVRAYEFTEDASKQVLEVGATSAIGELGLGGVKEQEWHEFGPVRKTMNEFREAYNKFLERCVELTNS